MILIIFITLEIQVTLGCYSILPSYELYYIIFAELVFEINNENNIINNNKNNELVEIVKLYYDE